MGQPQRPAGPGVHHPRNRLAREPVRPATAPPSLPIAGVLWAKVEPEVRCIALVRTAGLPDRVRDQVQQRYPVIAPASTLPLLLLRRPVNMAAIHPHSRALVGLVGATWLLMTQPGIAATRTVTAEPPRQGPRKPEPDRTVTIIELRRAASDSREPAPDNTDHPSSYTHRWLVRGHWKSQTYGPRGSLRRPVYIAPHIKGPEGAPLLETDHVHVWRK